MNDVEKKPLINWWATAAAVAYAVPAVTVLLWAADTTSGDSASDSLLTSLFYAAMVVGIGQLMRSCVHGSSTPWMKFMDGAAKIVSLAGWSLGIVGTAMFRLMDVRDPSRANTLLRWWSVLILLPSMVVLLAIISGAAWRLHKRRSA